MSNWQGNFYTLQDLPKNSDWQCKVCGVNYIPKAGDEPNWFHRQMQWLAFGFKWSKRVTTARKDAA